jgi:hypothetical protein
LAKLAAISLTDAAKIAGKNSAAFGAWWLAGLYIVLSLSLSLSLLLAENHIRHDVIANA